MKGLIIKIIRLNGRELMLEHPISTLQDILTLELKENYRCVVIMLWNSVLALKSKPKCFGPSSFIASGLRKLSGAGIPRTIMSVASFNLPIITGSVVFLIIT